MHPVAKSEEPVNQGKIASGPHGPKVLQQQSATLTSGNGIQCTHRIVHPWNDHCYSQAAQSELQAFLSVYKISVRAYLGIWMLTFPLQNDNDKATAQKR